MARPSTDPYNAFGSSPPLTPPQQNPKVVTSTSTYLARYHTQGHLHFATEILIGTFRDVLSEVYAHLLSVDFGKVPDPMTYVGVELYTQFGSPILYMYTPEKDAPHLATEGLTTK